MNCINLVFLCPFLQFNYQVTREHFSKALEHLFLNLKKKPCTGNVKKDRKPLHASPSNTSRSSAHLFFISLGVCYISPVAAAPRETVALGGVGGFTG